MRSDTEILQDLLNRIPSDLDKREGSVIYNALSAFATELVQYEIGYNYDKLQISPQTATGESLDNFFLMLGFIRETAEPATVKAEIIGNIVPIGSRFASPTDNYIVTEDLGENFYTMKAEEVSADANTYTGNIIPLSVINNLTSAKIIEVTIPQKDTETDEEFRERVKQGLIADAKDGNIAQYKQWTNEFDGIGKYKIFPLWNGVNTVKVSILNELNGIATQQIINDYQAFLDPNSEGLGNGQAPIGAKVTVTTATEKPINVSADIVFISGTGESVKTDLIKFFSDIAYVKTNVNYLQLATVVVNNFTVESVENLKANNDIVDIPLSPEEIAILGTLTINGVVV